LPCGFYLSFFPRLISAAADWMSTILPHMAKKSPPGHHRTDLSTYIFTTKACIDNRKNLLNSNI